MTSVLLDSGPLVMLLCGSVRPDLVGTGKTSHHTFEMFQRLSAELPEDTHHISLPNVLTEASNHLGAGRQQAVQGAAQALSVFILGIEEVYQPSSDVIKISEYMDVGLADAAILSCASRLLDQRVKVFTQDWQLYGRLTNFGVDCVNIMNWRTPSRYQRD